MPEPTPSSVRAGLGLEKSGVGTPARHQVGMAAALDNPALVENHDLIGIAHSGKAMADDDGGPPAEHPPDYLEELPLGERVECAGRLVKHDDRPSRTNALASATFCHSPTLKSFPPRTRCRARCPDRREPRGDPVGTGQVCYRLDPQVALIGATSPSQRFSRMVML